MTKRRLAVLLLVVVGGLVYSRTCGTAPDTAGTKADDTPLPTPVTKATAPARELNERERMLVGIWKFNESMPPSLHPGSEEMWEYLNDGRFVYRYRSGIGKKPYLIRGSWQIIGDRLHDKNDNEGASTVLIEVLTQERLVISYPNGVHRYVRECLRLRELPRWDG